MNMTLANAASVREGDVFPACFPDLNGQVFLRGHVTLDPVPAVGGALLAIFPLDIEGNCSCTPEENDVIASTTALALLGEGETDVCIVRLLIDKFVYADVNRDGIIDQVDVDLVEDDPSFSINPASPSLCDPEGCGPADVNRDGKVNQLDSTSISQSAVLGTNVTCGGVYATDFSCGSTRSAPLVPATSISLDTISYFSDDGLIVEGRLLSHQFDFFSRRTASNIDASVVDGILVEVSNMQQKMAELEESNVELIAKDKLRDETNRIQDERLDSNDKARVSSQSILTDVFVSVFVVLVCGIMVFFVQRKRRDVL